ncbi:MAG: Fic family protein [Candidatus Aenigmarchaeota archaeon]|nr:Fic family protein [Candidatus Aenigmarchaeota archaeon]
MVTISKKRIKGKTYLYISKSIRLPDGRVTTITKNIGKGIKINSKTKKKYEGYFIEKEKELNALWAAKKYKNKYILSDEEIKKIEHIRISYKYLLKNMDKNRLRDIFDRFTVNFTYDSNAIEGNSLTLKDVAIVIFDRQSIPGKSLREIYETRNSRQVVDMIMKKRFPISHPGIIKMHHILMKDIDERKGYKKIPNIIYRTEKEVHTTPPERVKEEMDNLINWFNKSENLHPLERAAIFHGRFEKIHPFEDGNGRVGRFIMNAILVNEGYPPLIIRKTQRTSYLSSLAAFDSGHEDKLKRSVLQAFKDTYRKFFEVYVKYT